MKQFTEIAKLVRSARSTLAPSQLAHLVIEKAEGEVGQFYLINVFAEAFPEIPLQQVKRASRWHCLCVDGMSDAEFDAILSPWITSSDIDSPPQTPCV